MVPRFSCLGLVLRVAPSVTYPEKLRTLAERCCRISSGETARMVLLCHISAAPIDILAPIVDFPAAGAPRRSTKLCSLTARTLRRWASVTTSRWRSFPIAHLESNGLAHRPGNPTTLRDHRDHRDEAPSFVITGMCESVSQSIRFQKRGIGRHLLVETPLLWPVRFRQ